MDALAISLAVVGMFLATRGQFAAGAAVFFAALVALAIGLALVRRLPTLLPFSFRSYFVVMSLCLGAALIVGKRAPIVAVSLFGFWVYYYACVALAEKQIRYVPWAAGLAWRTARVAERPMLYWTLVVTIMGMAALLFGAALARTAG